MFSADSDATFGKLRKVRYSGNVDFAALKDDVSLVCALTWLYARVVTSAKIAG